jgi:hypothetical protein
VSLQREQLITSDGVPDLARAIITARDKFVARLVEGAVRERQDMRAQNLEQEEVRSLVALQLFD